MPPLAAQRTNQCRPSLKNPRTKTLRRGLCETGPNNHNTDNGCPRDHIGQGFSTKVYEIFTKISGSNFRRFSNNVRVLEYNLVLIPVIGALLRTPRSISEIFIIDFFGVFTSPAAPYQ